MKLSIITINYNNKSGLEKTIASVMAQTYRDFDWIIIDGGSTDGSAEMISELAKNPQANINYWCSEPDKGVYNAMNKGIAHANGEYLNFMNSGDCFHGINTLSSVFCSNTFEESDVIYGDYYESYSNGELLPIKMPKLLDYVWMMHDFLNHQSCFIKHTLFNGYYYDESYKINADSKAFMTWLISGKSFRHINLHVAEFQKGGLNETYRDISLQEKKRIIEEVVPHALRIVETEITKYRKYSRRYPIVTSTYMICDESPFFRRIINCCLLFISKMHSITMVREKS